VEGGARADGLEMGSAGGARIPLAFRDMAEDDSCYDRNEITKFQDYFSVMFYQANLQILRFKFNGSLMW